jgi:hypothetical protein
MFDSAFCIIFLCISIILFVRWKSSCAAVDEWRKKYTISFAEWKAQYAKMEKDLLEAKGSPTVRALKNSELFAREQKLFEDERKLEMQKQTFDQNIRKIIYDKSQQYPYIAAQIADLYCLYDERLAKSLAQKARPAVRASEDVARIAREKRELTQRVKALEYQISEYEAFFPQLSSIADLTTSELCEASQSSEDRDSLRDWLSDSEYVSLSDERKFQLALDRWRRRPRSNWQVGRDFERYIGYLYEMNGWKVSFFGALNGKNDLCRDLIAQKNSQTLIIQCKRWAKEKTIHEKHVFQLFGSVMSYGIENPSSSPKGLLITTCPLSDVAKQYAHALNIDFEQNYHSRDLDSYPVIKCNIAKEGEKIFHLPFDQQYDRIRISPEAGEKYVSTVREAMDAGFRRAYRWHGSD